LSTSEESILYSNFEEAYNAYADVYNFVNNSFEKLERLKRKAFTRELRANKKYRTGIYIGIAGLVVGIVSVIIAILK
ncbi:MAG: hypothetical protein LBH20_00170, partial [Treponema sp.]|nr:hypothetical protein [Treponema sp.]